MWQVGSNSFALHHPFGSGAGISVIVVGLLVALLALPSVMSMDKKVKVGVLLSLMLVSILLFAQITETRVWFEFVPFGLFLFYNLSRRVSVPQG